MSVFTGSLVIEEVIPGRRWRLREALRYEAGFEGSNVWITVPQGFETDGASLPKWLRLFLAVWGTYGRAACVHDYLYGLLRKAIVTLSVEEGAVYVRAERKKWDDEFYLAMLACGTSRPLALVMWASVRVFGEAALRGRKWP